MSRKAGNIIRHIRLDEFASQNEVLKLRGNRSVNDADTWNEGYSSYYGRYHRRAETQHEARLKKICCEKSAEAILAEETSHHRKVEDSQSQ